MLYPDEQVREWLQEFRTECASTGGIPDDETVTLWRPTGPEELELLAESGWQRWPPRLPGQPIFYPVLNERYATQIARDWNVKASGVGYVTRFEVRREFIERYEPQRLVAASTVSYGSLPRTSKNSTTTSSVRSSWSQPLSGRTADIAR